MSEGETCCGAGKCRASPATLPCSGTRPGPALGSPPNPHFLFPAGSRLPLICQAGTGLVSPHVPSLPRPLCAHWRERLALPSPAADGTACPAPIFAMRGLVRANFCPLCGTGCACRGYLRVGLGRLAFPWSRAEGRVLPCAVLRGLQASQRSPSCSRPN